jgi:hypothetical protein
MTRRVGRATSRPTADPLRAPLIKSPSPWPGTVRGPTSAGRSASGVMWGCGCGSPSPVPEAAAPGVPDVVRPTRSRRRVPRGNTYRPPEIVAPESRLPLSSGDARRRRPAICSGAPPRPAPGIQEFARSPWLTGSSHRQGVRRTGPIRSASRHGAGHCATDGAGGAAQHHRPRPQRMAVGQPETHGFAFFGTPVSRGSRSHGNTFAPQGLQCCTWS